VADDANENASELPILMHTIRLRGPWEWEPPDCFRRPFHEPTCLQPEDVVWLVIESPQALLQIVLNENRLGTVASGSPAERFDIGALLQPYNRLEIRLEPSVNLPQSAGKIDNAGGLVGNVRLEIDSPW